METSATPQGQSLVDLRLFPSILVPHLYHHAHHARPDRRGHHVHPRRSDQLRLDIHRDHGGLEVQGFRGSLAYLSGQADPGNLVRQQVLEHLLDQAHLGVLERLLDPVDLVDLAHLVYPAYPAYLERHRGHRVLGVPGSPERLQSPELPDDLADLAALEDLVFC
ncbi:hypothetical protein PMIN06_012291 [Paraphaeosphaeria minitans]